MGQILAVDFGKKRCGLAATDDLCIIASGLDTVETSVLMEYLKNIYYFCHDGTNTSSRFW